VMAGRIALTLDFMGRPLSSSSTRPVDLGRAR
jgi:hypothetical protein